MANQLPLEADGMQLHPTQASEAGPHSVPGLQTLTAPLPQDTNFGIAHPDQTLPSFETVVAGTPQPFDHYARRQIDGSPTGVGHDASLFQNDSVLVTLATPIPRISRVLDIMPTSRLEDIPRSTHPQPSCLSHYVGNRSVEPNLHLAHRRVLAVVPVMEARAFYIPTMKTMIGAPDAAQEVMSIETLLNSNIPIPPQPNQSNQPFQQSQLPLSPRSPQERSSFHRTLEWVHQLGVDARELDTVIASWPLLMEVDEHLPRVATSKPANNAFERTELEISVRSAIESERRRRPKNIHAKGPLAAPAVLPRARTHRRTANAKDEPDIKSESELEPQPRIKDESEDQKDDANNLRRLLARARPYCNPCDQLSDDPMDEEPDIQFPQPLGTGGMVIDRVSGVVRKRQMIDSDHKYNRTDKIEERQIRRSKRLLEKDDDTGEELAREKKQTVRSLFRSL